MRTGSSRGLSGPAPRRLSTRRGRWPLLWGQPITSLDGIQDFEGLERLNTDIQGIRNLGELEEVMLSWNDGLRDLTPLPELTNLRHVKVSDNMEEALRSIDGADVGFELEIEESHDGND